MASRTAAQIIDDIAEGLNELRAAVGSTAGGPSTMNGSEGRRLVPAPGPVASRRKPLSPARKARLILHGRYLGVIRTMPAADKARVKALQQTKGYEAAIRLARRLRTS